MPSASFIRAAAPIAAGRQGSKRQESRLRTNTRRGGNGLRHGSAGRTACIVRASEKGSAGDKYAWEQLFQELVDPSELGQRGEIYFIGQLVLFAVLLIDPPQLRTLAQAGGVLLLVTGPVFIWWGSETMTDSLSPLPKPRQGSRLVTTGPFALTRHPLYTGLLLSAAGFTELTQSPSRALTLAGLWWLLSLKAAREEQFLVEKFGSDYEEYRAKTPKFLPDGRALVDKLRALLKPSSNKD